MFSSKIPNYYPSMHHQNTNKFLSFTTGYHFFPFPTLAFSKNQQKNDKTTRQITSPKTELCNYVRRHKRQEIKTKKWVNKYLYFFFHCCRRFFSFLSSSNWNASLHTNISTKKKTKKILLQTLRSLSRSTSTNFFSSTPLVLRMRNITAYKTNNDNNNKHTLLFVVSYDNNNNIAQQLQ